MRVIHVVSSVLFIALIVIFAFQNLQIVTVSFLGMRASAPLALVAVLVYLLGMASGGSVVTFLRRSIREATRHPA